MSRIAPIYSNRVIYKLTHTSANPLKIREPIGWRDDDNEFVRSKTFHGILTQLTNNLGFTNDGRAFIKNIYALYGVNAKIRLTKDERNPSTDVFERQYSGFLDLFSYEDFEDVVSVKFISSNLLKTIKSRENEKIELDRLTTFSGLVIPSLDNKKVSLNGRDIFLQSELLTDPEQSVTNFIIQSDTGNWRYGALGVNTALKSSSDIRVQAVFPNSGEEIGGGVPDVGLVAQLFYADNDRDKTLNININVTATLDLVQYSSPISSGFLQLVLAKYDGGTDYNIVDREILQTYSGLFTGVEFDVDASYVNSSYYLKKGESLSLQFYWGAELGSGGVSTGRFEIQAEDIICSIKIEEDSFFDATTSDVLLPHETLERYLKIITDEDNILLTNVLGRTDTSPSYELDGEAALIGATHGFKIRGFAPSEDEENRYKPMTSTLKDWYTSYFNTWNLGMGLETVGFTEKIRLEKKSYFYNRNVLINLGKEINGVFEYIQVNKVKRSVDPTKFNTGLEFGYNKGGEYEEAVGLDEPNGSSTFSTIIDGGSDKYVKLSKYRADAYGMEFCRRFQFVNSPTEDTKYDTSIWLLDMKRGVTSTFEQILGNDTDYFETTPTGIFSPQTASNLRLSPVNNLLRHGWWIDGGLTKYPEEYIRYGSSTNNSRLKTQLVGGAEYAEDGNIQNKDLEDARMTGDIIEFEYEVDYDLLQIIQGKSVILGNEIPNFYGLVAFKNEIGEIEKGYLQKLSPNGVGKWTILKYNNSFAVEEVISTYAFQDQNTYIFQNESEFIFN
tara:strand:- start:675 stop:3023 length:2349 start_codon:yes stop_codon:yes gene_type:complete